MSGPKLRDPSPDHERGHCAHQPGGVGRPCGAPATVHLIHDPSRHTIATCDEHLPVALAVDGITDRHPYEHACTRTPRALWRASTPERVGFCEDPSDELALAELVELQAVTS